MASPNLPEFDGPNLRIILAAGITQVDIEPDVYSQWKEWFKIGDNAKYPPAFRTVGGDPLTAGIDAGAYYFIQNQHGWRIRPAEEDATILITGNLAPEDSARPIAVPTLGNFTVLLLGLQPITQNVDILLEQSQLNQFHGAIHINTHGFGVPGTAFPIGTEENPVDNIVDARLIADDAGIRKFEFHGHLTLDREYSHWNFVGISPEQSAVNVNGQSIDSASFEACTINGAIGAPSESPARPLFMRDCHLSEAMPVTGLYAILVNCFLDGDVTLANGDFIMFGGGSEVAGSGTPKINRNGTTGEVNIRAYTGGVELTNFTTGDNASFDILSGHFISGITNTAGTIVLRGVGKKTITKGSPSSFIDDEGFIDGRDIRLIKALTAGDAEVSLDDLTITVYDPDNITSPRTVIATYDVSADGRIRTRTS